MLVISLPFIVLVHSSIVVDVVAWMALMCDSQVMIFNDNS